MPQHNDFGRIYNTRQMNSIIVALTLAEKFVSGDTAGFRGLRVSDIVNTLPHVPLIEWSVDDWNCLKQAIHSVHENILRRDANKIVWWTTSNVEDASVHSGRARSTLYSLSKLQSTFKYIKIQQSLLPLRLALIELNERENLQTQTNEVCDLDETLVVSFW